MVVKMARRGICERQAAVGDAQCQMLLKRRGPERRSNIISGSNFTSSVIQMNTSEVTFREVSQRLEILVMIIMVIMLVPCQIQTQWGQLPHGHLLYQVTPRWMPLSSCRKSNKWCSQPSTIKTDLRSLA
jgi:hypothetical protein